MEHVCRYVLRHYVFVLIALAASAAGPPASGQDDTTRRWVVSAGVYDTANEDERSIEAGLEYRFKPPFPKKAPGFVPALGVSGTEDGNVWVYGSLRYDLRVSKRFYVTPMTGVSLYEEGDGKDLGGPIEFRSGLEISYALEGGGRLGLVFYHLSNADIYDENPGSNSMVLTWNW